MFFDEYLQIPALIARSHLWQLFVLVFINYSLNFTSFVKLCGLLVGSRCCVCLCIRIPFRSAAVSVQFVVDRLSDQLGVSLDYFACMFGLLFECTYARFSVLAFARLFLRCAWLGKHERSLKWLRQLIVCAYTFFERSFVTFSLFSNFVLVF